MIALGVMMIVAFLEVIVANMSSKNAQLADCPPN